MCGRYTEHHNAQDLIDRFTLSLLLYDTGERFNVAPAQTVPVVTEDASGRRVLEGLQWGLVPVWAKEKSIGYKMINARSETVAEKPSFRRLVSTRRCVLPSDGFYEWIKDTPVRQPVYFRLRSRELYGFAGLWDEWQMPDGTPLRTCTILTTSANDLVATVHDRMPVLLPRGDAEDTWLDSSVKDTALLTSLLRPYPAEEMEAIRVSTKVNSAAHDDPSLLEPLSA